MMNLLRGGLLALQDYVSLHVLTCLIPAFLLAGAMVTFLSREVMLRYLGTHARKTTAFPLAALASFFVAACSCTVIPVAAGLYYGGAGIGAAFIVLWVAPAANILSLTYTGAVLGGEMVTARVVSALLMAFAMGTIMWAAFRAEERQRGSALFAKDDPGDGKVTSPAKVVLLALIVVSLLAPNYLVREGPYLHKVYVWAGATLLAALYAWRMLERAEILAWMKESWWFVRTILPLLLGGVFVVGVLGAALPETWVRSSVGGNGLASSFVATLFGAITYFATMTEAPFVDTLMKMGMGEGAALSLLLTGPGLSLPNWIAIARVFGLRKALVYVATMIALGTLAGWLAGLFYF
jgi:hypothetical protein